MFTVCVVQTGPPRTSDESKGPGLVHDQASSDEWEGQEALLWDTVEVVSRQSTFVKSPSDVQHKSVNPTANCGLVQ